MTEQNLEGESRDLRAIGEQVSTTAHQVSERVQRSAHQLSERVQYEAEQLGERGRHAREVGIEYARRAGSATGDFVAANALPLSLIGLGVGWLAWSARERNARQYEYESYDELAEPYVARSRGRAALGAPEQLTSELSSRVSDGLDAARSRVNEVASRAGELADGARSRASELADNARSRAGELASQVSDRVGELATQVSSQASDLSQQANERLRHARERSVQYADENPLMVGALAVAAGVGIGLLLPPTQRENQLLGDARDRLLSDARGLLGEARETADQVSRQAKEGAREIKNTVADSRFSH